MKTPDHGEEAHTLNYEGGDSLASLKRAAQDQLRRYEALDVQDVQVVTAGDSACSECQGLVDLVMPLVEAWRSAPLPVEGCRNGLCRCTYIPAEAHAYKLDDWDDEEETVPRASFPRLLWLLPVFFGLLGGGVAALTAGMKYRANWWGLFSAGVAVTVAIALIYWLAAIAIVGLIS